VGAEDRGPERPLRLPVERARELAVRSVRRGERRGAAGQGAVGIELHRADRQPIVTERSCQPERLECVELRRDRHRGQADAEETALTGQPVGVQLPPRDLSVDDRGDPGGERRLRPAVDVGDDLLERRVVVEARPVVPDVDARRDDELLGSVEAISGEAAASVADEVAARGIGGVVGQATQLQAHAVGERMVAAHVLNEDRVDPRRLVQVPAGRQAAVRVRLRVHPDGPDPRPVGRALRCFRDPVHESRDRADAGMADVDGGELRTGEREVVVGIHEPRQDRPAADIDMPRIVRHRGAHDRVAADGCDAIPDDRHPAAERRLPAPSGEHAPVVKDETGHPGQSSHLAGRLDDRCLGLHARSTMLGSGLRSSLARPPCRR
jgi:hypothetical protein